MDNILTTLHAEEIMQLRLAHSLGLDRYADIMLGNPQSPDFQVAFNRYYRIRRNKE